VDVCPSMHYRLYITSFDNDLLTCRGCRAKPLVGDFVMLQKVLGDDSYNIALNILHGI